MVIIGLNPTPHGVSDSVALMGGGAKKLRNEAFLTPRGYIALYMLFGIFRGHMQKISKNSQNLNRISGFHLDKREIDITRLILKILDSNFTCKP